MTVYVCSPYSAKEKFIFDGQLKWTIKISRELVLSRVAIIVPHLYLTQVLSDEDKKERELGLESAKILIEKCDAMFVSVSKHISEGMEGEIDRAEELDVPIYYFKSIEELKIQIEKAKLDLGQGNKKIDVVERKL